MKIQEGIKKQHKFYSEKKYPSIVSLQCEKHKITATLSDGKITNIPTAWFKHLRQANLKQLQNFEITPTGYGIHWPEIDEDISVKAFVEGLNGC